MTARNQRELALPEEDARAILLVQAIEETDRSGLLLTSGQRRAATEEARRGATATDKQGWLATRARRLAEELAEEHAFLPRFLRFTSPARGLVVPVGLLAFVLGLASNALGPEKQISVLAPPLFGLVLWNLAVFGWMAVSTWLPLPAALASTPRFVRFLQAMARRLVDRIPRASADDAKRELMQRALGTFLKAWSRAVAPLTVSRGRRLLHLSSLALVAGVVAGMYLRGIAVEYRATWESTFMSAITVDIVLAQVLGPAAAVLGQPLPSAAEIRYADAHAGPWIHLWAVTALLFVGLPRAILAAYEGLRLWRSGRSVRIHLPDSYVRRLLAAVDTSERRLELLPYSYRPPSLVVSTLKQMLYDLLGPRSEIRALPPLEYGCEEADLDSGTSRLRVLLFSSAQTPEVEVHGELVSHLREMVADGQMLLVMVDGSTYRQRLEGSGQMVERLEQRRRAWDRVLRDSGMQALHVDLAAPLDDAVLTQVADVVWPPGALSEDE